MPLEQVAPQQTSPCCRGMSALQSVGWLTLGMVAAFPLFAIWKYNTHGKAGITAAAVAFAICLLSASVALLVTHRSIPGSNAGAGLLASMVIRTGIPLGVGMMLANGDGWLASVGILGVVMAYYLVSLVLETAISVRLINRHAIHKQHAAEA